MMDPRLYFENVHPEARSPAHSEPSAAEDDEITAALRAYRIPPGIARVHANAVHERVERRKRRAIQTAKNRKGGTAKAKAAQAKAAQAKAAQAKPQGQRPFGAGALWRLRGLSR